MAINNNPTQAITNIKTSNNPTQVVGKAQGITDASADLSRFPNGLYGRFLQVNVGNYFSAVNGEGGFDIECNVPFDDDTQANEAEIIIYNLSDEAVSALTYNESINIVAGYHQDSVGVIFQGVIDKVTTKKTSVDKITTIYALDNRSLVERDMVSVSYSAQTQASTILRDLVNQIGLPVAAFTVTRDYSYENDQTVEGSLMSKIKELAGLCGARAYINKQAVYVQPLDFAESERFDISNSTGLVGDVEVTTEEETFENYTDTRTVYTFTTLLNHRMKPSSAVNLTAKEASGNFRVFKGEHICNENEFYTKVSCY